MDVWGARPPLRLSGRLSPISTSAQPDLSETGVSREAPGPPLREKRASTEKSSWVGRRHALRAWAGDGHTVGWYLAGGGDLSISSGPPLWRPHRLPAMPPQLHNRMESGDVLGQTLMEDV